MFSDITICSQNRMQKYIFQKFPYQSWSAIPKLMVRKKIMKADQQIWLIIAKDHVT